MHRDDIRSLFDAHWKPSWGSIVPSELEAVQALIAQHRPADLIEIGTASGLSAGFFARFMDENGGQSLTTIDYSDQFFGQPDTACGFQIHQIYTGQAITIKQHVLKTSLDLGALGQTWQMAFVDGNHDHPWPLLDSLALWPLLDGDRIAIYHDLDLYMRQDIPVGIGPKYLFDQVPGDWRSLTTGRAGNTFRIDLSMPREALEQIAMRALKLPWTLQSPLSQKQILQIRALLQAHYSPALQDQFETCLHLWNDPKRYRYGPFASVSITNRLRSRIAQSNVPAIRQLAAAWRRVRGH